MIELYCNGCNTTIITWKKKKIKDKKHGEKIEK